MKNRYIKIVFVGTVLVLLVISLVTYRNLNNYTAEVQSLSHSSVVFRSLEKLMSTIKDAETGHRGFQLTRDSIYLQPYIASVKELPEQLRNLKQLVADNPMQSRKVDSLENLVNYQFTIIRKILTSAQRSSLYMDRYESSLLHEGRNNMNDIRSLVKRIDRMEEAIYQKRKASEADYKVVAPIALLLYGMVALVGLSILFIRILDALGKRRVAEDQLKENLKALRSEVGIREFTQRTLRSVLDNSPSGIMVFRSLRDKDGNIYDFEWVLANTVSLTMTRVKESNLIGKRLLDVMPAHNELGSYQLYKEVVENGKARQFEKFYQPFGIWLDVTVVKFEDGFIITFADITKQKSQRLLLEERELLLNDAEHLAKMGSWKWTEKNNELIWSNGLCTMLGKPNGFAPDWNSFLENVVMDDRLLVEDFLREVKTNKIGMEVEYRIERDNAIHHFSLVAKPTTANGQSPAVDLMGTVLDITGRKQSENQMSQYTQELQRSNEDLEQFAYVASHDLQEPLRKIRAFGDRLANKYNDKLEGQGVDYIQRMQSAAARMQVLIEDLLAFSRVSKNAPVVEPLDTPQLLRDVIDDLDAQVRREEAVVRIGMVPSFAGDKIQMKRLFQNVVSNGIKFHKPGVPPVVDIQGSLMSSSEVKTTPGLSLSEQQYVKITIKDNGIGFDEKYAEKIFTIFHRLNGRNEYEGTGIGLSICRKIVSNHKGIIMARSVENEGSEFIIILPVA